MGQRFQGTFSTAAAAALNPSKWGESDGCLCLWNGHGNLFSILSLRAYLTGQLCNVALNIVVINVEKIPFRGHSNKPQCKVHRIGREKCFWMSWARRANFVKFMETRNWSHWVCLAAAAATTIGLNRWWGRWYYVWALIGHLGIIDWGADYPLQIALKLYIFYSPRCCTTS